MELDIAGDVSVVRAFLDGELTADELCRRPYTSIHRALVVWAVVLFFPDYYDYCIDDYSGPAHRRRLEGSNSAIYFSGAPLEAFVEILGSLELDRRGAAARSTHEASRLAKLHAGSTVAMPAELIALRASYASPPPVIVGFPLARDRRKAGEIVYKMRQDYSENVRRLVLELLAAEE